MAFRFEELRVWHLAADLPNEIDLMIKRFPAEERFSLATQKKELLIQWS